MDLESERALARQRLERFRNRFADRDDTFVPIRVASQWLEALMKEEVDPRELVRIRDDAMAVQNRFEIGFFTFCNHMDAVVKDLCRPSFGGRAKQ